MREWTYLFYDLETTDINPCFGQVLQFAAVRTTMQFKEIERHEIKIRLNADTIPAPGALIVNRIGVEHFSQGMTEYDAIQKIHALFNAPNTVSIGYNSLSFDDEFLRFKFYQNLFPPYTHQYANGCWRMDVYPITAAFYAFKEGHLRWPIIDGVVSLRLEHLNRENKLAEGTAHNAMADVLATVALAKLLQEKDDEMWKYCANFFDKEKDKNRIANCDTMHTIADKKYPTGLIMRHRSQGNVLTPVIHLGNSVHYPQQSLWLSLLDENILQCTDKNIAEKTRVIRKKYGESPFFIPAKERYLARFSEKERETSQAIITHLTQHPNVFLSIGDYYKNFRYSPVENCDAAAALYQIPFPTDEDQQLFRQFHAAKPEEKSAIAAQFSNPVHRELASRIVGHYFPEHASENDITVWNQHLAKVFTMDEADARIDFRGNKALTLIGARAEIETILKEKDIDEQQLRILQDYRGYLDRLPRMLTPNTFSSDFFLSGKGISRKRLRDAASNAMHAAIHRVRPV